MRYGKITVWLLTAAFLAAAVFWGVKESEWDGTPTLSAVVSSDAGTEEIACWGNEAGEYYFFLPSYADLSRVKLHTNTRNEVHLDNCLLTDGMSCEAFQWNLCYDLTYTAGDGDHCFSLTFVQSANVPAMYIQVASGSMDYIHEEKGNEEQGTIRLYTAEGELDHYGNLESVKGRGNYTWTMDKKPYSLKLSSEANLLGMGKAQRWILLANAGDPSHLRNKLVFDYADAAGLTYSPDSAWVDLYLNGEYAGLYLLSERNEIHPQRVALEEDSSFLVSMELDLRLEMQGYPFIYTGNGSALRIHHSSIGTDELWDIWFSAENAILAQDGIDPVSGKSWTELIDLDSWARKYLIEEIFGSVDACAVSQFFYGDLKTGIIYAGPVWDYDNAIGNSASWQIIYPNAFFANRATLRTGMDQPWFHALYQKEEFYNYVIELYQTVFRPLLVDFLNETVDGYRACIAQAGEMDLVRWPDQNAADADNLKPYLTERMAFLDSVWLENTEYCYVLVDAGFGCNTANYAILPGEYLPELPEFQSDESTIYYGWYTVDTDEPFDTTKPIYENTEIYLKYAGIDSEEGSSPDEAAEQQQVSLPVFSPLLVFSLLFAVVFAVNIIREKTSACKAKRTCFPFFGNRAQAKGKDAQKDERTNSKIPS